MERTARPDLIGDLFKVGALDPARLPGHPCPPGKDDGSMRSNLLPFQVRLSSSTRRCGRDPDNATFSTL
jgi:hypothetical protein